ncbi:MAG: hypothetical protein ACR2KV_06655 [Solirubrobacteraceae bacterium]
MTRRRRVLIGVVVVLSAAVVVAYFTLGEKVSAASISHSVAAKVGKGYFASCRSTAPRTWTCAVMTNDASAGGIAYAVTNSGRCWHGTRVATGGLTGLPASIAGCIGVIDQLRLNDRLKSGTDRRPGFY